MRERRERGGYLPRTLGVGRTGKGPPEVLQSLFRALGAKIEVMETVEERAENETLEKALKNGEKGSRK